MRERSRLIYVLLAMFTGLIGGHDMYAGYYRRGCAKLFVLPLGTAFVGFISVLLLPCVPIVLAVIAGYDIFTCKLDAEGRPFAPGRVWPIRVLSWLYPPLMGLVFLSMIWPAVSPRVRNEQAALAKCRSQLQMFGMLCVGEAEDHDGRLPAGGGLREFRCPYAPKGESGYVYFGGGARLNELPSGTPLAMDRLGASPRHRQKLNILVTTGDSGVTVIDGRDVYSSYAEAVRRFAPDPVPEIVLENAARADAAKEIAP